MKKNNTPVLLRLVRWGIPKLEILAPKLATRLFVQLFFTPLRYRVPEKEKEWISKAELLTVLVRNKKVQVYAWGEKGKPVILFVHGWAGRGTQFRKFFPPLIQAGLRVLSFDGPSHGNSEGKSTNILEFEEALKEIFKAEGAPQTLIAHSFGGVAVLFAAMNGLPVKKLIAIASPTIGDRIIQTFLNAINGSASTGEAFKQYMVRKYGKTFDEFSIMSIIKRLAYKVDILLVYDEDDLEVTMENAESLISVYPSAMLKRTKGLGHTRILKDEEVIIECIRFIQMS